MTQKLSPQHHFAQGRNSRQNCPLPPNNPYKFLEARDWVKCLGDNARAVLDYHRSPRKGGDDDLIGPCLARERIWWTEKVLREGLPSILGRNAVPGLEVVNQPSVSDPFETAVVKRILPDISRTILLPKSTCRN